MGSWLVNGVVKTLSELGIVSIDLNSNRLGYGLSEVAREN